jgi:methionine aminopeptidase
VFSNRGLEIKTPAQIDKMRVAGLLVGETLELLRASARAGVTTGELDAIAETNIRAHGGIPSFKGYSHPPFPATICASVNDEVVHGIPGAGPCTTATSSPSTAAPSSTAGTATPPSRSRSATSLPRSPSCCA